MTTDVENNEWKAEAPYLASLPVTNPFRVPEQYFNALPSSVNGAIFTARLKEGVTATGFSVPENYFVRLQDHIRFQTSQNLFHTIPAVHGYSTPDHYFEKLQSNILAKTAQEHIPAKKETKIVRLWHSDLLKYASAACFILVTAFGLYLNQQNDVHKSRMAEMANEQMLYDIDEQDIIDQVQGIVMEDNKPNATNEELETYILNNYSQNDLSNDEIL